VNASFDGLTTWQFDRFLCKSLVLETVVVGKVNGSNDSIVLTARADLESHLTGRLITATTAFDLDRVDWLVGFEFELTVDNVFNDSITLS